jgi:hypothetical protein
MSRNQEKIEIFNAAPRFRKSLLYTSSTKKSRSEFFLIHHSLKKYLHFSHTWLDNKYSIFAIRYVHWFFFHFDKNSDIESTAKRKLERLQFSTSSSFFKIWCACSCEFKAYFWIFLALYHLLFDLETIKVN